MNRTKITGPADERLAVGDEGCARFRERMKIHAIVGPGGGEKLSGAAGGHSTGRFALPIFPRKLQRKDFEAELSGQGENPGIDPGLVTSGLIGAKA